MKRRNCLKTLGAAGALASFSNPLKSQQKKFKIDYVLASALYGNMPLSQFLPEFEHTGAVGIDIWGKPHGTQREEIDEIGVERFTEMLAENNAKVTVSTRYPLGPFGLQKEMPILKQLGGKYLVCASEVVKNLSGHEARRAVQDFIVKMIPHADAAAEHGQVIAIENHSDSLISSPESIMYFAEFNRHPAMGIALAPQQLKDHISKLPEIILTLGNENLPFIYFQEFGDGAHHKLDKQIELEQLPGRGPLDYSMIVRALKMIEFSGVAEIFMHPTPRGVPIMEQAEDITEIFNESRAYIDGCVRDLG